MCDFLVHSLLQNSALKTPNEICVQYKNDSWSYIELYNHCLKIKKYLDEIIVVERRNIGIHFNNDPSFLISFFGILMAGHTVVPIPYYSTQTEVERIIHFCDIKILFTDKKFSSTHVNTTDVSFVVSRYRNNTLDFKSPLINKNSPALILPTSGSTGDPKFVMLSHYNIYSNAIAHGREIQHNSNDIFIITMPLSFSSTITTQILSCIYSNVKFHIVPLPLFPRAILNYIEKYKINCLAAVPSFLMNLIEAIESYNYKIDFKLSFITISGAPVTQRLNKQLKEIFPKTDVIQTYGLTEASPRVTMMRRGYQKLCCGKPVDGVEIKINKQESKREGEISVRGVNIMIGYYKNKKLTQSTFNKNWLRTGDIGYLDSDGDLHLIGRKKNIIISGGINIYPEEIEEFFFNQIGVIQSMVIGEKHYILGESPVVYLTINNEFNIKNIYNQSTKFLSRYKIPKRWYKVKNIPLNNTGKVIRTFKPELLHSEVILDLL
ncbi:hypothetical protein CR203_23360 [Salipaludibacillus neizhouensis]|uniref:Uncharacterized protein n=1 Tax=Salipaludibacillus neizhouensis TaxID=885475 RepID=A0A3A9JXF8_9BACI|nr:class I adenylate-forming enzyme family protein [Salipaludibacillus neizhouensis]RKL64949.1 hypothetical protein CR203_23360 [Salipaludibacillus neizhouensis]